MPDKEQWGQWKDHPCTQAMIKILREMREEGFEEVSYGSLDDQLLYFGTKIGKINGLTLVINLRFIPEEDENDGRGEQGTE